MIDVPFRRVDSLEYRPYDPSRDTAALEKLFRESFPESYSAGVFGRYQKWMNGSPAGPGIQLVADDRGRLAGALSYVRQRLCGFGRTYLGALATNAMTSDDYRRRGLYRNLSRYGFEVLGSFGADFVYGYTVRPGVLRAELRIGYHIIGDSRVLAYPLQPVRVAASKAPWLGAAGGLSPLFRAASASFLRHRLRRVSGHGAVRVEEVTGFDPRVDELIGARRALPRFEVLRDAAYLNWKYVEYYKGSERFRLFLALEGPRVVGFSVCGRLDMNGLDGAAILDMGSLPDRELEVSGALLAAAAHWAMDSGAEVLGCMVDDGAVLSGLLRRVGFLDTGLRFRAIFQSLRPGLPEAVRSKGHWHHMWGGSDTV